MGDEIMMRSIRGKTSPRAHKYAKWCSHEIIVHANKCWLEWLWGLDSPRVVFARARIVFMSWVGVQSIKSWGDIGEEKAPLRCEYIYKVRKVVPFQTSLGWAIHVISHKPSRDVLLIITFVWIHDNNRYCYENIVNATQYLNQYFTHFHQYELYEYYTNLGNKTRYIIIIIVYVWAQIFNLERCF